MSQEGRERETETGGGGRREGMGGCAAYALFLPPPHALLKLVPPQPRPRQPLLGQHLLHHQLHATAQYSAVWYSLSVKMAPYITAVLPLNQIEHQTGRERGCLPSSWVPVTDAVPSSTVAHCTGYKSSEYRDLFTTKYNGTLGIKDIVQCREVRCKSTLQHRKAKGQKRT